MAGARALWVANGMKKEMIGKPIVAIVNSFTQFVPGHTHLHEIGQQVKAEIEKLGCFAAEFNTIAVDDGIAMGHDGMLYSLPSRDIIADSVEYMVNAHKADAMVCISNCDKITPGMLMAAMRLNIPTVFVSGGPKEAGVPRTVVKNMVADLDKAEYPESVIVPFMEIVHDRINIEVLRGCTRGCRFCQAGMIYRPVRERSVQHLLDLAQKLVDETGYEEITLSSLSTGDYSCLPQLAHELMEKFAKQRIALSLPSLRLDSELKETLEETQKVRKTSLTYAMEAGTQRLRDVINKGITEEDLMTSVTDAFAGGWSSVKLYFMFGLPTETMEDLDGISDLASKVVRQYFATPKHMRAKGLRVHCSASCFVPKPFTPFQWEPQDTIEQFKEKQKHLCQIMRIKGVEFNWHEPQVSFLEAVFARGDRKVADVLEAAWKRGCRFDGWSDQFKYDSWMQAFEDCGVDPEFYANRRREKDELLPWAFIDAGVTQAYRWRERERAVGAQTTPDCRKGCQGCGLKRFEGACEGR